MAAGESLARSGRVFLRTITLSYEHIGTVLVVSGLWFLFVLPSAALALMAGQLVQQRLLTLPFVLLLVAAITLLAAPATASVSWLTGRIVRREDVAIAEFFRGFARFFKKAAGLALLNIVIGIVLAADLLFAWASGHVVMRILAGLWMWIALFWILALQLMFPILAFKERGPLMVLKQAALVTADNPVVALSLLLQTALFAFISALFPAAGVLLFGGVLSFSQNVALQEILEKYAKLEPDAAKSQDTGRAEEGEPPTAH